LPANNLSIKFAFSVDLSTINHIQSTSQRFKTGKTPLL